MEMAEKMRGHQAKLRTNQTTITREKKRKNQNQNQNKAKQTSSLFCQANSKAVIEWVEGSEAGEGKWSGCCRLLQFAKNNRPAQFSPESLGPWVQTCHSLNALGLR